MRADLTGHSHCVRRTTFEWPIPGWPTYQRVDKTAKAERPRCIRRRRQPLRDAGVRGARACGRLLTLHRFDEALGTQVGPVLLDVFKALVSRRLSEYRRPAL